eukprot:scaffold446_cov133-Skeletonema_dohrnii-CCMP3373.AAC.9
MAKAAKSSKTTTKATKAAKKTAAASGKENAASKKQNARSNAGKGGTKKKSGGSSAGGEGDNKNKKSGGITKAVQKRIDAWWEQHSLALVKKTVEDCDCIEADARDIVKAYQQFLVVKREMKDWENELIPCDKVAAMMELHELHEDFDYQSDMQCLCDHDFGGNQLLVCGKDDDSDREKATFEAVKKRFGSEFNEELWNTVSICIVEVDGGIKWDPASEDLNKSGFFVDRQKSDPLQSAFEAYTLSGDPVEPTTDFQFLLSRTEEVIDPNDTASGLRLTYRDATFALYTSETFIEVKVEKTDSSGPRLFYAAEQMATMSKALQDLVKDGEGDETEYVFMFKGKRLYGFETPMSLQMKHFDIIDAIPSQDYKYQRCICCNNAEGNVFFSQCTEIC